MRVHRGGRRPLIDLPSGSSLLLTCVVAALGVPVPAQASTVVVNDCTDSPSSGSITLRSAIAAANASFSNTLVDLSGLSCSTITLATGAINVIGNNVTILGPSGHALTIDAAGSGRIFNAFSGTTLEIDNLTLTNGLVSAAFYNGGCVQSAGTVVLKNSVVTQCAAYNGSGGGIYASGGVEAHSTTFSDNTALTGGAIVVAPSGKFGARLYSSSLEGNTAHNCGGAKAYYIRMDDGAVAGNSAYYRRMQGNYYYYYGAGGGICGTTVTLNRTTVANNHAVAKAAGIQTTTIGLNGSTVTGNSTSQYYGHRATMTFFAPSIGGGIFASSVTAVQSTIDNNYANNVGAIYANNLSITNSTVSGNRQHQGANLSCVNLTLQNSTVAFNYTVEDFAGIFVASSAQITSSILANNHAQTPSGADDLAVATGSPVTVSASLITSSYPAALGAITSDPQLAPLANRGGLTRTHALTTASPAVGAGLNPEDLTTDQRGSGFARSIAGKTDIGAYQRQPDDDEIFYNSFDQ